jgi:tetratricopeptide (TPR) repeat protein
MKLCLVYCLVCIVASVAATKAFADDDYYQALELAERATAAEAYVVALRKVKTALRKYRGDYQLTVMRAHLEFRLMRYRDAEQSYRSAVASSGGAVEARLGLGWSLLQQGQCAAAVRELETLLSTTAHLAARRGIEQCQAGSAVHGSAWSSAGGATFVDHPWKRRYGDASVGMTLQPIEALTFSLAYHFLRAAATDRRVADVSQHELYLQGGLISGAWLLQLHGAMVWSADPATDGSTHAGLLGRYLAYGSVLEESSLEVDVSRYPDLWVGRVAASLRLAFGTWSITPGISISRVRDEPLIAGSMSLAKTFGALTLWGSGKVGPEYRAAYLSQFALLNSEDRSVWSGGGGARARLTAAWSLLASYFYLRMRTPDALPASMHLINIGIVYSF